MLPDAMGDGEQSEKLLQMAGRAVSQGFVRSSNLYFLKNHGKNKSDSGGGDAAATQAVSGGPSSGSTVAMSASALAIDQDNLSRGAFEEVKVTRVTEVTESRRGAVHMARMKGYEGDACGECGNFTLLRNGTCMKCDTCGATNGCS